MLINYASCDIKSMKKSIIDFLLRQIIELKRTCVSKKNDDGNLLLIGT